jgi:hypothetical protein
MIEKMKTKTNTTTNTKMNTKTELNSRKTIQPETTLDF